MPFGCSTLTAYSKIDCATDVFSYNRIVALGILKPATFAKDMALAATWGQYIDGDPLADPVVPNTANVADDVVIIPAVEGEWDGGEFATVPGFGTNLEIVESGTHTVTVRGEYNKKNEAFFNDALKARNNGIALVIGNRDELVVVQKVSVTILPKLAVTNELEKFRKFELTLRWPQIGFPAVVNKPGVTLDPAVFELFF